MIVQTLKHMTQIFFLGFVLALTPIASSSAQESVAEMILNDCKKALVDHCSKVTPGRGRIVACLYAHSDKLSDQCSLSLEIGVVQLRMILSAVSHVVEQCQADLDKYCGDVEIGGGRMYQCMSKNRANLEQKCKTALIKVEEDLK